MSGEGDLTYRQLLDHAKRIAAVLRESGVRPGEVVATQVPEHLALVFAEALFHEAAIGTMYPATVGAAQAREFDWLITTDDSIGYPEQRTIRVDDHWLRRTARQSILFEARRYASRDSVCRIVYSSGTSGAPVGVPFALEYLDARAALADRYWVRAKPFMALMGMNGVVGLLTAHRSVAMGATYLCRGTDEHNLAVAARGRVAALKGSPVQLSVFARELAKSGLTLDSLRWIVSAGAPTSHLLEAELRSLTGAEFVRSYASTEAGPVAIQETPGADPWDAGRIVDDVEIEIIGDGGQLLAAGGEGEIRLRRRGMPTAYHGEAAARRELLRDGWFHPGDLGAITPDRRLLLSGRATDVVNAGGVKIDPARVDDALRSLGSPYDVATFGFTTVHGITGLGLAITCPPDTDLTPFIDTVRTASTGYTLDVVRLVDAIPLTATGKVDRGALARAMEADQRQR